MNLLKTSTLNGLAVAVRVASALVLNKILAVYVGPSGYAVIGQFQNVLSIVINLAGGVVALGVTKETAQNYADEESQHAIWRTALILSLGASLVFAVLIIAFREWLSARLLQSEELTKVFIWLALCLPAISANNIFLAIVNGKKDVGVFITSNIVVSLTGLVVMGGLVSNFGLRGALIALTIVPAIGFLTTILLITRRRWFKFGSLFGRSNSAALHTLSKFALMSITSAITIPITYILIRDHIVAKLGISAAGYWQATWKISEIYLMLFTTTLSVYYLPRLAEIKKASELKLEIRKVLLFTMPLAICAAVLVFLLRDFLVSTLFTPDFIKMRELIPMQLLGDVLKIASWIFAYIMLGRALVKTFIITDLIFSLSFVVLVYVFVDKWQLLGVTIAYVVNYAIYGITMVCVVNRELKIMKSFEVA